jgi:hypothetical protein
MDAASGKSFARTEYQSVNHPTAKVGGLKSPD